MQPVSRAPGTRVACVVRVVRVNANEFGQPSHRGVWQRHLASIRPTAAVHALASSEKHKGGSVARLA
jgi:hypothetical protein